MAKIDILEQVSPSVWDSAVEYVERKGRGHPDSLIDGIVERASLELSKYYIDNFGAVLHHNLDKALIIGGESDVGFGRGKITKAIEIIIAGRATKVHQGAAVPVDELVVKAAEDYLKENTRFLDIENEVIIETKIRKGSEDLTKMFSRSLDVQLANDTSFGIGFAPFTKAERLALEVEMFLNSADYKKKMPMVGEDIKVFTIREEKTFSITLAAAFVAKHVKNIDEYIKSKEAVVNDVKKHAKEIAGTDVEVVLNTSDDYDRKEVYLTKSGLSCEAGDDGEVGRGNRANGLITPFRPMSLEATAGKNPVSHTGKIYNVLAREIAIEVVKIHPQVKDCVVSLVSQIGRRIDDPRNMSISVVMQDGEKLEKIKSKIYDVGEDMLSNIGYITRGLADGKYEVF